jgi:predicted GIY-YIG superfamily endonuclease
MPAAADENHTIAPYDPTKDWLVYVLISQSSVRTYVGIALDMRRRLAQHNGEIRGGASSTRAGRPWAVGATYGPFATRGAAQQAEARLKKWSGSARLEQCASALH